jgi:arylsulfatase A
MRTMNSDKHFRRRICSAALTLVAFAASAFAQSSASQTRPNVVYILADDLGYGDIGALNPHSKIKTPQMDRLAAEGMTFTEAHSSSAVCTPSRYSILTGRYNWRSRLKSGVLNGFSKPLIEPGRLTVAAFLRDHGYHTACIGKWHLGLEWARLPAGEANAKGGKTNPDTDEGTRIDFTKRIQGGPTAVGSTTSSASAPRWIWRPMSSSKMTTSPRRRRFWLAG